MNASEMVVLRGGLAVPLDALRVVWGLEGRGVRLSRGGRDIIAQPRHLLTDTDRAEIRRLKPEVLTLLAYEPKKATA